MSVERDFELLGEILEDSGPRLYKEGQAYAGANTCTPCSDAPCTADCRFRRLPGTSLQPKLFCCKDHGRVHVCGTHCQHKIMSREGISCEWTGEAMDESLIAEEQSHQMIMVKC